jgi:hypothetical protein
VPTAAAILSIPETSPETLFRNFQSIDDTFRDLAKTWHPDRNTSPDATDVFAHISRLHDAAVKKSAGGIWDAPPFDGQQGVLRLETNAKVVSIFRYHRAHDFQLGRYYVSDHYVLYLLKKEYRDLHEAFIAETDFKYPSDRVKKEMERLLPKIEKTFETKDHLGTLIPKTPDVLPLRDVLSHLGKMDGRHVAWVLSRLYNIACYLAVSHIHHNDISIDSVFISPAMHSALLLGGWWYSTTDDEKLWALPRRTAELSSKGSLLMKIPDPRLDLECIRLLGCELFGDPSGVRMKKDPDVPSHISAWLRFPRSEDAFDTYAAWRKVLEGDYGPPKFVKMELDAQKLYMKGK